MIAMSPLPLVLVTPLDTLLSLHVSFIWIVGLCLTLSNISPDWILNIAISSHSSFLQGIKVSLHLPINTHELEQFFFKIFCSSFSRFYFS